MPQGHGGFDRFVVTDVHLAEGQEPLTGRAPPPIA
jgi:hypothetical protein